MGFSSRRRLDCLQGSKYRTDTILACLSVAVPDLSFLPICHRNEARQMSGVVDLLAGARRSRH